MTVKREAYEALHRSLIDLLSARMNDGTATAADLNVARQLLKDSNLDFVEKNYTELSKLANLPYPTAETLAEKEAIIQ